MSSGEGSDEAAKTASAVPGKVEIRLKAVGNAPIMETKIYKVDGDRKVQWIVAFIRKYLKMGEAEQLFVYVNHSFAPSPDQTVRDICECFGHDGKLVLYYAKTQMWG